VSLFRDISGAAFKSKRITPPRQVIQSKYFWFSAADSFRCAKSIPVAGGFRNVDDFAREFKGGSKLKTHRPKLKTLN
jgi:hypothetical protein